MNSFLGSPCNPTTYNGNINFFFFFDRGPNIGIIMKCILMGKIGFNIEGKMKGKWINIFILNTHVFWATKKTPHLLNFY